MKAKTDCFQQKAFCSPSEITISDQCLFLFLRNKKYLESRMIAFTTGIAKRGCGENAPITPANGFGFGF